MGLLLVALTFTSLLSLTFLFKRSLLEAAVLTLLLISATVIIADGLAPYLLEGYIYGILVAFEITVLVFGALLLYNYLVQHKFSDQLEQSMTAISNNSVIIAILLCYFFSALIEGVSGFGTPAMIVAPLLLVLRFPAALAAGLPLLGNTVTVLFGAVGTPLKVGFADLNTTSVPFYAAILMTIPALMLPFMFRKFIHRSEASFTQQVDNSEKAAAGIAGICFVIPYLLFARVGPDFPTIAAAVTGLACWLLYLRMTSSLATINRQTLKGLFFALAPYLLAVALLICAKVLLEGQRFVLSINSIGLSKTINFFQPGVIFILTVLILFFRKKIILKQYDKVPVLQTSGRIPGTFLTIASLAIIARILSASINLEMIFQYIQIHELLYYPLPVLSGFAGSFMAGSATVSNLMFGEQWQALGIEKGLFVAVLLAGQLGGAALGNALSFQNIALLEAILNKTGMAPAIYKQLAKPILTFVLICCIVIVMIALLL